MPAVKSYFLAQKSPSGSDKSWIPAQVLVALTLMYFLFLLLASFTFGLTTTAIVHQPKNFKLNLINHLKVH